MSDRVSDTRSWLMRCARCERPDPSIHVPPRMAAAAPASHRGTGLLLQCGAVRPDPARPTAQWVYRSEAEGRDSNPRPPGVVGSRSSLTDFRQWRDRTGECRLHNP